MTHCTWYKFFLAFISIFLILSLSSCAGTQVVKNETWKLISLISTGEREDHSTEIVEVRNCGVKEKKTYECSAGTASSLSVNLGVSGGEGLAIAGEVSSELGIGRESGESLDLESPPDGMIYQYQMENVYKVKAGELLAQSNQGNEKKVEYKFNASCSVKITDQKITSCDANTGQAIPDQNQVPTSNSVESTQSRGDVLVMLNKIYQAEGWCGLWTKLVEEQLVQGTCPTSTLQFVPGSVLSGNGSENLIIGVQARFTSDTNVNYPACVTFDKADYSGGIVEDWVNNTHIGSNMIIHPNNVLTLYFRCDDAWAPK